MAKQSKGCDAKPRDYAFGYVSRLPRACGRCHHRYFVRHSGHQDGVFIYGAAGRGSQERRRAMGFFYRIINDGFDYDEYDKDGYNRKGFDRRGFDRDGFDASGYNWFGFDRDGFYTRGFNIKGIHRSQLAQAE